MQENSFGLRIDADSFAQTLHDLTQFVHLRRFPFDSPTGRQGYFSLRPIRLPANPIGQQPVALYMRCSYTLEGEPPSPEYPEFWAIRFEIVPLGTDYINVTAECAHRPVVNYFLDLLKKTDCPLPGLPKARGARSTGWPDGIQVTQAELEQTTAPLPFEPQDIYRHLCALCDHDACFLLGQPETSGHMESLAVLDAEAVRLAYTATQATIGTMHLLPVGNGTAIQFTPHDAPFYDQTPARGHARFREWIRRVVAHFDELARQPQITPPSPAEYSMDLDIMLDNSVNPNDLRKKAEIRRRREKVKEFHRKGLSIRAIADLVCYSESTVRRDLGANQKMSEN